MSASVGWEDLCYVVSLSVVKTRFPSGQFGLQNKLAKTAKGIKPSNSNNPKSPSK
jgi:hypothetical protein